MAADPACTTETPARPSPEEGAKRADIATARIYCVVGGSMFGCTEHVVMPDGAPTWAELVPVETGEIEQRYEAEGKPFWPRERSVCVCHELLVGTVREIVADFEAKLTRAFNAFTMQGIDNPDGQPVGIPSMHGAPDLGPQHECLIRNGITAFTVIPNTLGPLEARAARRAALQGRPFSQNAATRLKLRRLVALWSGGPPGEDPSHIDSLVFALLVLKGDQAGMGKPA